MPNEYTIDAEQHLVRVRMWGALTQAEILTVVGRLIADPRCLPGFLQLIDLREASTAAVTGDHLRQIASSDLDPASRRAFVVADPGTYGLARLFAARREMNRAPEQIAVFTNIAEAEAWLGLK
jgi:hypothetical protein